MRMLLSYVRAKACKLLEIIPWQIMLYGRFACIENAKVLIHPSSKHMYTYPCSINILRFTGQNDIIERV